MNSRKDGFQFRLKENLDLEGAVHIQALPVWGSAIATGSSIMPFMSIL